VELDPINAKRNFFDIVDELIQYFTVKTGVSVKITKEGDFLLFYWRIQEKIGRKQEKRGRRSFPSTASSIGIKGKAALLLISPSSGMPRYDHLSHHPGGSPAGMLP